jgi:hypothetical protein
VALDLVHLAVELADAHDAVEERGVAVVVKDQVATWRLVADVSGGGIVPFWRTLQRPLAGKRRGLLDAVVVAEGERQWQLSGEIARRGVFVQPGSDHRIVEGDSDRRVPRGVGVLVAGAGLGPCNASGVLNALALANPMPEPAPVTTATRSRKS